MFTEYPDLGMHLLLCTKGLLNSILMQLVSTLVCVLLYGILVRTIAKGRPWVLHSLSIFFGYWILYDNIGISDGVHFYFILVSSSYVCLFSLIWIDNADRAAIQPCYVLATSMLLFICEHFLVITGWLEIRGMLMIVALKGTSITLDIAEHKISLLNPLEYFGYMFCPANCLFGPVFSFGEYISQTHYQPPFDLKWAQSLVRVGASMLVCLIGSTCIEIPPAAHPLVNGFLVAFTFRLSHYFICYLSEFTMIAAGFDNAEAEDSWNYCVAKPFYVEFPDSLQSVINYWNIPMYKFLKKMYYTPNLSKGRFYAIFATFVVSSMFHGFNIQVTVILLHLAVFSYIQLKLRYKLARRFNACLKVRDCRRCRHQYTTANVIVCTVRFTFILWAMVDLAYLGSIMSDLDVSYNKHFQILKKIDSTWRSVGYVSHMVNLIMYVVSLFV